MNIKNYWIVTILFFLILEFFTFTIFFLFGYYVLGFAFFTQTSKALMSLVLLGWAISQLGLALFFQVFLNKARSATIIGYLLSIWTSLISVTFNVAVYPDPYTVPYGMRMYPPFGFARIIYVLSMACSNGACF